jgi:selT/selW/selH-like putative selenoprotein
LADVLKKELGITAELIKSSGGVFEVEADGKLIFSKKQEHRFPTHTEILESLKGK